MFLGILINYLDRINISQSIIVITKSFSLSGLQKGWVLSSFAIGYVAMMMVGGYAVFKWGARAALAVSMILLSAATICCGLSVSFFSLLICRFLVGIFEAPVYPAFASIAGIWFPKQERVKAIGFFDIGSYVGVGFATLAIVFLITHFNWRVSFVFSGLLTFSWAMVWCYYYRDSPAAHPKISRQEIILINKGIQQESPQKVSWLKYLANRKVIGISTGFFCFNYLKSFYLTWLPTYMVETKGIKLLSFGFVGSIPILFAIVGEIITAYYIDRLISKGGSATYVKKAPICVGLILSTVIIFSLFTSNTIVILMLLTISYVFLVSASVGIWSIPEELAATKQEISIIGSIQNTFSNIAGIIAPIVTGYFYEETNSFLIPFLISIVVSLVGAVSYWKITGELTIIKFQSSKLLTAK